MPDDRTSVTLDFLFLGWWAVLIVGLWPMLAKAGRPASDSVIPILNLHAILKLAGVSGLWMLAYLIPIVNVFVAVWVGRRLAVNFGRSPLFGFVFLFALQPIGFLILGYGRSEYDLNSPLLAVRNIRATELA